MVTNMTKTYSTWQIMRFAAKGKRMTFVRSEPGIFGQKVVTKDNHCEFFFRDDSRDPWEKDEGSFVYNHSDWTRVIKKKKPVAAKKEVERVVICDTVDHGTRCTSVEVNIGVAGTSELVGFELLAGPGWRVIAERDKE